MATCILLHRRPEPPDARSQQKVAAQPLAAGICAGRPPTFRHIPSEPEKQIVLTIPRSAIPLACALVMALAGAVEAQTGTLIGRVLDAQSLQPLASAQVSIAELGTGVLTQQDGRFILTNLPAGTHTVTVQRIGYREVNEAITVAAGESVERDFAIAEEALAPTRSSSGTVRTRC